MILLANLEETAVVVRGGSNRDRVALAAAVERALTDDGEPVLSVYISEIETDWAAAVLRSCVDGPVVHGRVQVATVGSLVAAGFRIADERSSDESYCHYHVYFDVPVTQSQADIWLSCFSQPILNPAKVRS